MSRLRVLLRRLAGDQRGVAALEFALWASCIFVVMLTALDFGLWRTYQLRLSAAVEQGAMLAFNGRDALDQGAADGIGAYVAAAARVPGEPVTVRAVCNGGMDGACLPRSGDGGNGRTCACIATSGGNTSYAPATCGSPCPGSAPAGYYLTITASYPYRPVVLPRDSAFSGTMAESATIRLQ